MVTENVVLYVDSSNAKAEQSISHVWDAAFGCTGTENTEPVCASNKFQKD